LYMCGILLGLTVHEFAHAKAAQVAGDDTAERAGRISLNPLDHLEPMGTVMMIFAALSGFGLGWGKPVPVNHLRLRHPRMDSVKISMWGPLSNLIMAFILGMVVRFVPGAYYAFSGLLPVCILVNLSLAIFNLLPISPLDGSHIVSGLLPVEQAKNYDRFMGQYGFMILLGLIFFGRSFIGTVIGLPVAILFRLFVA
jgi:Zn-dependent protease